MQMRIPTTTLSSSMRNKDSVSNEIKLFLLNKSTQSTADGHLKFISDDKNVVISTFLADIFQHVNSLNLKLQGDQMLIYHLVSEVNCFCKKT